MNTPTTVYIDYNAIKLAWDPITLPADTGSDDIIYYMVQFYDKTCFYGNDIDSCPNDNIGTWTEVSQEAVQGA